MRIRKGKGKKARDADAADWSGLKEMRAQGDVRSTTQIDFVAASSFGKRPRVLMILRSRACTLSSAAKPFRFPRRSVARHGRSGREFQREYSTSSASSALSASRPPNPRIRVNPRLVQRNPRVPRNPRLVQPNPAFRVSSQPIRVFRAIRVSSQPSA